MMWNLFRSGRSRRAKKRGGLLRRKFRPLVELLERRELLNAQPFKPGDLVIYRTGDGTTGLVNTGNPVFLDEYTPTGTLVQSIEMPTSASGANNPLIASGAATSEGQLTRSTNGQYITLTGYDAALGSATSSLANSTTIPRVEFSRAYRLVH